jgi:hypothetical protein
MLIRLTASKSTCCSATAIVTTIIRREVGQRVKWRAGPAKPTFCIPAQQTIPCVVRWMLAIEDHDEDRLYLAKGVPRAWVASAKPIRIEQAPTRWGRINFDLQNKPQSKSVVASVELARAGAPKELHVKLRMPLNSAVKTATVNGKPATIGGVHNDTVIIRTENARRFEVIGLY